MKKQKGVQVNISNHKQKNLVIKFNGQDKRNQNLKQCSCLILLSIKGNEDCQGEYLKYLTTATKEFSKVIVLIADEVFWHNIIPFYKLNPENLEELKKLSVDKLKKIVYEKGEKYFNDNLEQFLNPINYDKKSFNEKFPNLSTDDKIETISNIARELKEKIFLETLKKLKESSVDDLQKIARQEGENYFNNNLEQFLNPINYDKKSFNEKFSNLSTDEKIEIINNIAKEKGINYEIIRWQTWQKQYESKITIFQRAYEKVSILKEGIMESAKEFTRRKNDWHNSQRINNKEYEGQFDSEEFNRASIGYLEEESTLIWFAAKQKINFIAYASRKDAVMMRAFQVMKDVFINPKKSIPEYDPEYDPGYDKIILTNQKELLAGWIQIKLTHKDVEDDFVTEIHEWAKEASTPGGDSEEKALRFMQKVAAKYPNALLKASDRNQKANQDNVTSGFNFFNERPKDKNLPYNCGKIQQEPIGQPS